MEKLEAVFLNANYRFEYLEHVEKVQEIRKDYFSLGDKTKESDTLHNDLRKYRKSIPEIAEKLVILKEKIKTLKEKEQDFERRYESVAGEMQKARELDVRIKNALQHKNNLSEECNTQKNKIIKNKARIQKQQEEVNTIKNKSTELQDWFTSHKEYESIIPKVHLILNFLKDMQLGTEQLSAISECIKNHTKRLGKQEEQQQKLTAQAEELNRILPSEILRLRRQLADGQACPVCGSIHHIIKKDSTQQETEMQEDEIERAKKEIHTLLTQLNEQNDFIKKEVTKLEVQKNSYEKLIENSRSQLNTSLNRIKDWERKLESGKFVKELEETVAEWNKKKEEINILQKQSVQIESRLQAETEQLQEDTNQFNQKSLSAEKAEKELHAFQEERKKLLKGKPVQEVEEIYMRFKKQYINELQILQDEQESRNKEKARLEGLMSVTEKNHLRLENERKQIQSVIQAWLNKNKTIYPEQLEELTQKSPAWLQEERNYKNDLLLKQNSLKTKLEENKKRLLLHMSLVNKPKKNEDLKILEQEKEKLKIVINDLNKKIIQIDFTFQADRDNKIKIQTLEKELKIKKGLFENWDKLNVLFGSADGKKFRAIAQGYTLDVLVSHANKHLENLTKRYRLERIPDTLALQVADHDMLGEVRTIHSLSGGESFLISLALALGLSSLSSNRMNIESLFIDEGFGALDMETLGIAMEALEHLQTQGKKIGVISHIADMNERIPVQIRVVKSVNGKSNIKVTG